MGGLVTEGARDSDVFYKTGYIRRLANTPASAVAEIRVGEARP